MLNLLLDRSRCGDVLDQVRTDLLVQIPDVLQLVGLHQLVEEGHRHFRGDRLDEGSNVGHLGGSPSCLLRREQDLLH